MNIGSISGQGNFPAASAGDDRAIRLLEKQKMQLQDQIQTVNTDSKLDDKAKLERVNQLQEQIQQIDMRIQQIRNEKLNPDSRRQTGAVKDPNTGEGNSGSSSNTTDMDYLIQAGAVYSQAKTMNNTKNRLHGKGNVLEIEIKLDEKRGGEAKAKRAELHNVQTRERMLEEKAAEANTTAQGKVREASRAESEGPVSGVGEESGTTDSSGSVSGIGVGNSSDADGTKATGETGKTGVAGDSEKTSGFQTKKEAEVPYKKIDVRI